MIHDENASAPLSFGQELLWLMDRASPGTTVWNVPRVFRISGSCNAAALQQALDALAARHEPLRTVFVATDDGARALVRPPATVPLRHVDLRALRPDAARAEALRLVRAAADTPFDLSQQTPLRAALITLAPHEHLFSLDTHHIVSDGWSKSVTLRELSALYDRFATGAPASLPALPLQFSQYAAWERSAAHQATLADDLTYWRRALGGVDPAIRLPLDRPRPATPTYEAAAAVAEFPQPLVDALRQLAREHGATLYMALLAGFASVLHRYSGQEDIVIGSPSAGRMEADTENLIGLFANTLVLRTVFSGHPSFAELLRRVRETALDAYQHQAVPVEQLVLELQQSGALAAAPLFGVVMTMEDTLPAELRFAGAEVQALEGIATKTKFDLTLLVRAQGAGLRLTLLYRTDIFEASTAERALGHLRTLLDGAVIEPERPVEALALLTADERKQFVAWNATPSVPAAFVPISEQIGAQAARSPQATAVVCGEEHLTYAELWSAAAAVQRRLRESGTAEGTPVGVYLERSLEAVVAMCGIMRAGAAFVPLPPDAATERLTQRLGEAGVTTIVTTAALRSALPPHLRIITLAAAARGVRGAEATVRGALGDDVAYVVFTSGSTGIPKGVAVTHGNLAHYTAAIRARLGVTQEQPWHFATVSTIGADLGYTAIFAALTSGGTLHVVPADIATNAARFSTYAAVHPLDVLKITPSHLAALLDGATDSAFLPRRWLIVGGEACSWQLVRRVESLGSCRILNHYGPCETTVGATTFAVGDEDFGRASPPTVPIGRPLPGVRCYVLDHGGEQLPLGVEGELSIGGAGVARGYVNRPELTAERFVADPFGAAGARMYRTGDRVRRLRSGDLEFLGRRDDQVKVRGFRVELGEIESVLCGHPAVARCAVRFTAGTHGNPRLDAYVVLRHAAAESEGVEGLRPWLAERLPEFMLPASIVVLDRLPLSPSGKLDVAGLPNAALSLDGGTYAAPRTPTESIVAEVIATVLKRERVGVDDNFLQLGFQSILAIRALGTLGRRLGVRPALRVFFECPTVAQLAQALDAEVQGAHERELAEALALLDDLSPNALKTLADAAPDAVQR